MLSEHRQLPIVVTVAGIALFAAMDAFMKSASLAVGAYSALLLRTAVGVAVVAPLWLALGGRWPARAVLRIHMKRGIVVAFMALTFFFALVRLPLAEAIALSFVAPLIALYLAAILLGEAIERRAVVAAVLGLAGVVVIVGGKLGTEELDRDAVHGLSAMAFSTLLYAWNLVIQREQALVARPLEVATFQNGVVALTLLPLAPLLFVTPEAAAWRDIGAAALLATGAAIALAWAYARAEAQVLLPIEYSAFLWAALFGWLFFREELGPGTVGGAALIVVGCWIAARRRPEQSAL
ncbi:DMT family transporter [Pelagerythrobacter rhizovicinus]|uniref:DMT family transporter n=1 Tax=Pelagerythrobacter rhizovicinus TaxID=2268576 RepID=A0A4Q2KJ80_9SPHN|nr:DMT family transporter [Pelagerythrobacter rhizovicinus]RXZ64409.1 DMT family transporter [Pelagerythrobacter rhizovicinus]